MVTSACQWKEPSWSLYLVILFGPQLRQRLLISLIVPIGLGSAHAQVNGNGSDDDSKECSLLEDGVAGGGGSDLTLLERVGSLLAGEPRSPFGTAVSGIWGHKSRISYAEDNTAASLRKKTTGGRQSFSWRRAGLCLELHVNTFGRNLQLAALGDLDLLDGLVAGLGGALLDLLNDVVALEDLAEDNVTAIEPPLFPD